MAESIIDSTPLFELRADIRVAATRMGKATAGIHKIVADEHQAGQRNTTERRYEYQ